MPDKDIVRADFVAAYAHMWNCSAERAEELLQHVELSAVAKAQEPQENEIRLALSPDHQRIAIYEPGNGPWFVAEPIARGRFVSSSDFEALGWTRYVKAQATN